MKTILITVFTVIIEAALINHIIGTRITMINADTSQARVLLANDQTLLSHTPQVAQQILLIEHRYPARTKRDLQIALLHALATSTTHRHTTLTTLTWLSTTTHPSTTSTAYPLTLDLTGPWANVIWTLADLSTQPIPIVYALPTITSSRNGVDCHLSATLFVPHIPT